MMTLKPPFGSPVRLTGAVIRLRLTVFTRLPFTVTTALTNVTCGTRRIRMVNRRRLTHRFADGSENAWDAVGSGTAVGVGVGRPTGTVVAGGAGVVTGRGEDVGVGVGLAVGVGVG